MYVHDDSDDHPGPPRTTQDRRKATRRRLFGHQRNNADHGVVGRCGCGGGGGRGVPQPCRSQAGSAGSQPLVPAAPVRWRYGSSEPRVHCDGRAGPPDVGRVAPREHPGQVGTSQREFCGETVGLEGWRPSGRMSSKDPQAPRPREYMSFLQALSGVPISPSVCRTGGRKRGHTATG